MPEDNSLTQLVALQALAHFLRQRLRALHLCLSKNLPSEVLVLTYVTIDNLASLDRAPDHATVTRGDFLRWVDTYLLPGSNLKTTALDLWGARCGLVHDYSPESNATRAGDATEVLYVWGKRTEQDLEQLIEKTYAEEAPDAARPKAVHLEHLLGELSQAVQRFMQSVRADPARQAQVLERARQLLALLPGSEWGSDGNSNAEVT